MSDEDTLAVVARHLGLAMRPLGEAVADVPSFQRFMGRMGWAVSSLPPSYAALAPKVDAAITAVDAMSASATPQAIGSVLDAVKGLHDAIVSLNEAPQGVDAGAFLGDLAERLIEILLMDYLGEVLPGVHGVFTALGVITSEMHEAAPGRPAYVETRFRFDEIPRILADPGSIPTRVYGWGTPDLDFTLLASQLHHVLLALDIPAGLDRVTAEESTALQAPSVSTEKAINSLIRIPLTVVEIAAVPLPLDIVMLELPAEDAHLPGVIVRPDLPPGIGFDVPITDELKLRIRAGSDIAQTFGIALRPDGLEVRYPFAPGTNPPSAGFGLGLDYLAATPTVLLGAPGASRLEMAGASTDFALDLHGTDAELQLSAEIRGLQVVLALGDQDGFIGKLFAGADLTMAVPLGVRWSNKRGFAFIGSAGLEVTVAPHLELGPITVDAVHLGLLATLSSGQPPALTAMVDVNLSGALGPIGFSVEGIGVQLEASAGDGNAGPLALSAGLRGPTGLGAVVDAGPVTGGGFLSFDRPAGRYAGILQLRVFEIAITAIGLLDTKLPDGTPGFSLLIIISAEFPPIQLGYGFTLNGVGGLAGVNRTMVVDAIQAGLRNHSVDHIMFPEDPIRNAPQIISDLRTIFPPAEGRFVFGPMAMIGWGTPTLIRVELGIIIELPMPIRLVLLGQVSVALPTDEFAIIELHLDILGVLDFEGKRFSIDASLHDSRVAAFSVFGDMAFRLFWGEPPSFALSVGGLHPQFQPPAGFPSLRRVTVSIGFEDNPRISIQGYMAVTSNSLQFGALAEVYAEAAGFNVYGWLGFDALFVFVPFSFAIDYSAGFALRRGTDTIAGIRLTGRLSGPQPWHVLGQACISVLFWDVCVGFDVTFGDDPATALPTADPWPLLDAAIRERQNWSPVLPPNALRVVALKAPADASLVLIDPVGGAAVRERVLPLNRPITKFGEARPVGPDRYTLSDVRTGSSAAAWATTKEFFARAQFEDLSDAEKISVPSFERMDAGFSLASDAVDAGAGITTDLTYETRIVDDPWDGRVVLPYALPLATQRAAAKAGAAGRSPLNEMGAARFAGDPPTRTAALDDETYVVASTTDLRPRAGFGGAMSKGDASLALKLYLVDHPEDGDALQVVPVHEAAA